MITVPFPLHLRQLLLLGTTGTCGDIKQECYTSP